MIAIRISARGARRDAYELLAKDLCNSEQVNFHDCAGRLVNFQRNDPVFSHIFSEELRLGNLRECLDETLSARGGIQLRLPTNKLERLSLLTQLLTTFADRETDAFKFAYRVFRRGNTVEANLRALIDQVIQPYLRDYHQLAEELVRGKFPKASSVSSESTSSNVTIHGSFYGGLQVNSPESIQNVSVSMSQFERDLESLHRLLEGSSIGELQREDADEALKRLGQLAKRERTPDVLSKVKEKLELIKNVLEVCKDAGPYISSLAKYFFGSP